MTIKTKLIYIYLQRGTILLTAYELPCETKGYSNIKSSNLQKPSGTTGYQGIPYSIWQADHREHYLQNRSLNSLGTGYRNMHKKHKGGGIHFSLKNKKFTFYTKKQTNISTQQNLYRAYTAINKTERKIFLFLPKREDMLP